jgi:hypothetical protein
MAEWTAAANVAEAAFMRPMGANVTTPFERLAA